MSFELQQDGCDSNELSCLFSKHIIYSLTDTQGVITNVSDAFCEETGYAREDVIGKTHAILRAKDFPDAVYKQLWDTINQDKTWKGQIKNVRRNGEFYWTDSVIQPMYDDTQEKIGYISIRHDITKEKACEALSMMDELTGIYNRRKFNQEIRNYLINYYRYGDTFSLLMLDIDHFKKFNDRYGHLVGDEVLKRVCTVVQSNIREGDFFARWGGEEFCLIFNKVDKKEVSKASNKLLKKVREDLPIFLKERFNIECALTCSIGVTSPVSTDSAESLLARADTALYMAKENGRNRMEMQ